MTRSLLTALAVLASEFGMESDEFMRALSSRGSLQGYLFRRVRRN